VQRRRKPKAAPRNIFGGSKPKETKQKAQPRRRPPIARPVISNSRADVASVPETPIVVKENVITDIPVLEANDSTEEISGSQSSDAPSDSDGLIESQLLGTVVTKITDLQDDEIVPEDGIDEQKTISQRAAELIESSLARAAIKEKARNSAIQNTKKAKDAKTAPIVKKTRPRRRQSQSYQPAERARRLDRSRHMEYKYEMKSLLADLDVSDEYRSNILATVWARGERQTTNMAKEFLEEKVSEGAIDDNQLRKIFRVIDDYTIRR